MNKKFWMVIGLLVIVFLAGFLYKKQLHLLGDCEEKVTQEASSENHQIEVTIVNCGATTNYATHVALKENNVLNKIVVIKGDHSKDLKLNWVSPNKASIEYLGSLEDAFNFKSETGNLEFELSPVQ